MIGAIFAKFSQLILMKIIKIVATRCQILRLKCTNFSFGWGSAPDPAGGACSVPPYPLLDLRDLLLRREEKEGVEGREKSHLLFFCGSTPWLSIVL